jgi:hypothetical protein
MPRIKVNNKEIVVCFQHGQQPSRYVGAIRNHIPAQIANPVPNTDYTKCVVLVGENNCRDEDKSTVGKATVVRYYKDAPNRVVARRIALQKALENSSLNHYEREAVWSLIRK